MSSNIHSFRDINQNQQNNNEFRPVNFASSENENNSDENCCSYTAKILCPYFNIYTFTFFVTVLDVCMYFLTLILGYGGGLLKIRQETLDNFGMKVPFKVYRGQIHRLILYGILHSDFLHILFNVISQLSIGFNLERFIGHLKIILIYIISNICGGLFSCLITSSPSVGASVAICGLFGSYIAFTFINYYYLDTIIGRQNKYCNLIIMGFFVFIMCISAFNNNNIDNFGHIGGLIYGFFSSLFIVKPAEIDRGLWFNSKSWEYIGIFFSGGLLLTSIALFWFVIKG